MIALPRDAEDRGNRGGEVWELEEVGRSGNCLPELRSQPVRSRRGRVRCSEVQEEKRSCLGGAPGRKEKYQVGGKT
jgi:hypothetical protein